MSKKVDSLQKTSEFSSTRKELYIIFQDTSLLPGPLMPLLVLTSNWTALAGFPMHYWPLARGFRPGPGS